jgi:phosphohistidine swiveling domain-containing protein
MGLVRNFQEIGKHDAEIAGGKGASLGEMTRAGIPVPPGFVVLSDAFEEALFAHHHEIDTILQKLHIDDLQAIEHASTHIRKLILETPLPAHITYEIMRQFDKLNATHVAIRSSATAEDGAAAAWAGQLDSYLNRTRESVLDAVQHCWASLFTPRAIFYRIEQHAVQKISVAVVIQKMVDSEVAGVAFSAHPVTQDRNQIYIEGALGLGHAVVSGEVTPDSYLTDKNGNLLEKHISNQKRAYVKSPQGNMWREIDGSKQKLSDEEITKLARLVVHIEQHYGFPVDVEWALERGEFYIVQSRPITTLSIRHFQKFFTRGVPLALIELWHKGEYDVLKQILQGATHFNPLFISRNGKVNVYYDMNNEGTALQPLLEFISKNPEKYHHHAKEYEKHYHDLLHIVRDPTLSSLEKIGPQLWGFTPVLMQVAESSLRQDLVEHALKLREDTQDKDEYLERYIHAIVKKHYPDYEVFWNVLLLSELTSGKLPSHSELERRRESFVFFEQNIYTGISINELEKKFSIKIDDVLQIIGKEEFVLEWTREIPVPVYYLWYLGHIRAFERLNIDPTPARKVYAEYAHGMVRAYTQKNNLYYIKQAIEALPGHELMAVISSYEKGVKELSEKTVREKSFMKELVSGFIITFVLGDMEHEFTAQALRIRKSTETFFYDVIKLLKLDDAEKFSTYDELLQNKKHGDRKRLLLYGDGVKALTAPIPLKKHFSREHSLFYIQLWSENNLNDPNPDSFNIENVVFIREPHSDKVSVWYDDVEVNAVWNVTSRRLVNDPAYFAMTRDLFYKYWERILPYLQGERIGDIAQLKQFYNDYLHWWTPMATIFEMVDLDLPEEMKQEALRMREESQEYTDAVDELYARFFKTHFPQYIDIMYVTLPQEIFDGLSDEKAKKILQRLNGYALVNGKMILYKELDRELKKAGFLIEEASAFYTDKLEGTIGCKGKVQGKVRLLLYKHQIPLLQEGEILVTEMTSPDFLPAMKKASAIVTDEGGMTSHAAISARELNKPCIVGTRMATKIFKDGDLVEVDANQGTVRKV